MKRKFTLVSILLLIVISTTLSGCGGGELPEEAKERLDDSIIMGDYEIIESMKAPRKENGPNAVMVADEVWCVLVDHENYDYMYYVVWRTGLHWTARDLNRNIFLMMECTNVAE